MIFRLLTSKTNAIFTNVVKTKPSNLLIRYINQVKPSPDKKVKSAIFLVCSPWKLCTGVSLGLTARLLYNSPVFCKANHTRIIQRRPNIQDDSAKFDWKKLFEYLKPHKWLLAAAVAVSISIPKYSLK